MSKSQMVFYKEGASNIVDIAVQVDGQYVGFFSKQAKPGIPVVPEEQAYASIRLVNRNNYCKGVEPSSADDYNYALEVLPPEKFGRTGGVEHFYVMEAITDDLHHWHFNYNSYYYRMVESRNAGLAELVERVKVFHEHR